MALANEGRDVAGREQARPDGESPSVVGTPSKETDR